MGDTNKTLIGKRAFELFINNNCQDYCLTNYAKELGLSVTSLKLNYLIPYTKRDFKPKPTPEELIIYQNHRMNQKEQINQSNEMINFIHELLNLKYAKQVENFITHTEYTASEMFKMIDEYTKSPISLQDKAKLARVTKIIAKAKDIIENKSKSPVFKSSVVEDLELKQLTKAIIEKYLIVSHTPFDEIMNNYSDQISVTQFGYYFKKLTNGNADEQFLIKRFTTKLDIDAQLFELLINTVTEKLKKSPHKFSILDYYRITSMKLNSFLLQAKILTKKGNLNQDELYLIKDFINNYEHGNTEVSENELIDYSGVNTDYYSKMQIINYLRSIGAPLTLNTYKAGFKEFAQNYPPIV